MACIIHYEDQKKYDESMARITEKTREKIISAKVEHENLQDDHITQCKMIPHDKELTKYSYHKYPCYKKFTRILQSKNVKSALSLSLKRNNSSTIITSTEKRPTRSSKISNMQMVEGLLPEKRPRLSSPSSSLKPEVSRHLLRSCSRDSSNSVSSMFSSATPKGSCSMVSPSSSSTVRNKVLYGRECVICNKYETTYYSSTGQKLRSYPQPVTLLEAAKNIKESAKTKEKYSALYTEICNKDLIAAEFKSHHQCRIELIRKEREKSSNKKGDPVGDFRKITNYIDSHVLERNEALSMDIALQIYTNDSSEDPLPATLRRRRSRLQEKLLDFYGNKILILAARINSAGVIINASNLEKQLIVKTCQEETIKNAAKYIRHDIEEYCKKLSENPTVWPPTIEELMCDERLPPPSVILFLTNLLKSSKHSATRNIRRLVESYASDLVYSVSNGVVMTPKHYLFGLSLHSLTGKKNIVQIANRLGHSISYDNVLDIEAAQAKKAQIIINSSERSILPLKPASSTDTVSTVFWVDNLDKNLETERGGGAINMTTMMAFQEMAEGVVTADTDVGIEKRRTRTLTEELPQHHITIDNKQEPPNLPFKYSVMTDNDEVQRSFHLKYFTWLFLRNSNSYSQRFPSFPAFLLNLRMKRMQNDIKKTVETYLPPLTTKVTDPSTIYTYMQYLKDLADEINMKYVCITLDVGAAINAYKVLWANSQHFSNVVIQLGDFHYLKENFKVLGNLVRSSGFEDIIFQSCVCTSGSLSGVMSGSHYNRAWRVHKAISEALERLLYQRFRNEMKPQLYGEMSSIAAEDEAFVTFEVIGTVALHADEYERFKDRV